MANGGLPAVEALTRSRAIRKRDLNPRLWKRQRKPGMANGGLPAVEALRGTPSFTIRNWTSFIQEPEMEAPGTVRCAARARETTFILHPFWRCGAAQANWSGIFK